MVADLRVRVQQMACEDGCHCCATGDAAAALKRRQRGQGVSKECTKQRDNLCRRGLTIKSNAACKWLSAVAIHDRQRDIDTTR